MKKLLLTISLSAVMGLHAQEKQGSVYMVSNAHFDTQWNWDVQTSISEYVRNTLTQNLWLLENYPEYVFNFEGGVKYAWMKEYYPSDFEKVRDYIKSGRWHVSGSSWDANDPNMPSPESFIHNILYGQLFYKEEFGVKSTDIFLPDCFGFGYTLPTVAAHCGVTGFSTQKLQWRVKPFHNGNSKVPFTIGLWQGIDKSRIIAAADARNYTARYDEDLTRNAEILNLVEVSPNHKALRYYGTGDRGGSPTIASVESVVNGVRGNGPLKVISATSDQLFREYMPFDKHPGLPVFDGELLMDIHATGCYTSQGAMKLYNRRNEQLGGAAQSSSVIASLKGGLDYPVEKLAESWKRFIWHQFHDDLTGTSIPKAYTFSWNDELLSQSQFMDMITASTDAVSQRLNTAVKGAPLVVYNPVAHERREVVCASVEMVAEPEGVEVWSPEGKRVNAQLLSYADGKARIAFAADLAPLSYSVWDVRSAGSRSSRVLKISDNSLENRIYKVTLDANGDISSIIDKRSGRQLVEPGKSMRLALFTENPSHRWPAWEIFKTTIDSDPVTIGGDTRISVAENGPARVALRVERTHGNSKFVQEVSLTDGGADDRIDVQTAIDWRETNALLKVEFPMNVSNPEATYDLGIGAIRRGVNTETAYEVYAQQWADITSPDDSYGVTVVNNCKYGWDKPNDNTLRLTLLHTPETRDKYSYQDRQDFGRHILTYSIIGHGGNYVDAGIVRKADAQNNPPMAFTVPKHAGDMGRNFSMAGTSSPQIDIKTLKKAERGDYYIVRVYETAGRDASDVAVNFGMPVVEAKEMNGIEEEVGPARFEKNRLLVSTTAFRPKTYAVRFATTEPTGKTAAQMPVDMKFNAQGYTNDAFIGQPGIDIDGEGNSYSYDLLPDVLDSEGVGFRFGRLGHNNILRCQGDTVLLPGNGPGTLYLLVASARNDREAIFTVNGKEYKRLVPYYSGFFGQWGFDGAESYVKDANVAWVGTHRHNKVAGNQPYVFTYMYKIAIPITPGANALVLPDDKDVIMFAATVCDKPHGEVVPAGEYRALP